MEAGARFATGEDGLVMPALPDVDGHSERRVASQEIAHYDLTWGMRWRILIRLKRPFTETVMAILYLLGADRAWFLGAVTFLPWRS
jgi:hypothetical protein